MSAVLEASSGPPPPSGPPRGGVVVPAMGDEAGGEGPLVELLRQSALHLVASSESAESQLTEVLPSSPPLSLGESRESESTLLATGATLDDDVAALLPQNLVEEDAPAKGPTLLSASVHQRLDAGALQALSELETAQADAIALRLEQAGSNVRNPSAYVHRAVNNARRRVGAQPQPTNHALDQSALAALAELPTDAAQAILDELTSKGAGVRNPSAYVVKAVGNARRGTDAFVAAPRDSPRGPSYPPSQQPVASQQQPVVQAASPARARPPAKPAFGAAIPRRVAPAGRPAPPPNAALAAPARRDSSPDSLRLDPKAAAALANLPASQAAQILAELQRKRAAIRNPSAYVMRATANAHAGQFPAQLPRRPTLVPYLVQPRHHHHLLGPHFARTANGVPEAMPYPKRACSS